LLLGLIDKPAISLGLFGLHSLDSEWQDALQPGAEEKRFLLGIGFLLTMRLEYENYGN
jgi:hypothetical protein